MKAYDFIFSEIMLSVAYNLGLRTLVTNTKTIVYYNPNNNSDLLKIKALDKFVYYASINNNAVRTFKQKELTGRIPIHRASK